MKIAVWHNLPSGGGKRALYDHVRGLVVRGHTVEAWCPPTADETYLPLSELITEHVIPFEWQPDVARFPLGRLLSLYRNPVRMLKAMDSHCQQCAEEINQGGFDLLLANPCKIFRTTSIGRFAKIPRVLYLQEPYRWLYEAMPQLPWVALPAAERVLSYEYLKKYLQDLVTIQGLRVQVREELINARAYDLILVNSFFSRESILRAYGLDAQVCYLGVDANLFSDQGRQREDFIVGLGAVVPEKNIGLIIRALAEIPSPRPSLVWVTNYAQDFHRKELERLAVSADVNFMIRERISDQELVDVLNTARMMVYAPRLEPFGLAPLEANACGLPVVAVAEGGVRETIIDGLNGLVVEHDPRAIADAVRYLMNDKARARELGQNGRKIVEERWTMAQAVDHLEQKLMEVLSGGRDVFTRGREVLSNN